MGSGLAFSLAALLLVSLTAGLRLALPRGRSLVGAILFAALNFGAAFGLAYYALVELHAGNESRRDAPSIDRRIDGAATLRLCA